MICSALICDGDRCTDGSLAQTCREMAKDVRQSISLTSRVLRRALELSTEGIVLLYARKPEFGVAYVNPQFSKLSGYSQEQLARIGWGPLFEDAATLDELQSSLKSALSFCSGLQLHRADGSCWRSGIRIEPVYGKHGSIDYWLCQFIPTRFVGRGEPEVLGLWSDLEAGRNRDRFGRLDRIDASSGLLRFERFKEFLERDIAIAVREQRCLTLLILKINEYAEYQKTFGINAADSCLRMIGKQVTATLRRATDLCARMGDDAIVAAVFGQSAVEAEPLLSKISENVDGLKIHNPRGRSGGYLSVQCASAEANPSVDVCTFDALLNELNSKLAYLETDIRAAQL